MPLSEFDYRLVAAAAIGLIVVATGDFRTPNISKYDYRIAAAAAIASIAVVSGNFRTPHTYDFDVGNFFYSVLIAFVFAVTTDFGARTVVQFFVDIHTAVRRFQWMKSAMMGEAVLLHGPVP